MLKCGQVTLTVEDKGMLLMIHRFFLALESRVYVQLMSGDKKDKVVSETIDDENLIFL